MTTLLPLGSRRSRWLFDWSAAACLAAVDQSLDAQTGQVATFTRASVKTAIDANGLVYTVPSGLPAFHWSLDPASWLMVPALLLEEARTNVVLWSRDLTNAAWTKTNVTAAHTTTGADGVPNSATSLTATAANGTVLQAITLASSVRFQSAYVKRITGSGVINMTLDNGATWTVVTVTSAWTRVSVPTQTLANPAVGFRIVTSGDAIAVDFVQNENANFASSPIVTTTVAVARAADELSFALNAVPSAITIYEKHVDIGSQFYGGVVGTVGIYEVGEWGTYPAVVLYASSATLLTAAHHNGVGPVSITVATGVATGDVVETRTVLAAGGSVTPAATRNGGTEVVGAASAGNAPLGSTWGAQRIRLNAFTGGGRGYAAFQSFRIAPGLQALAAFGFMSASYDTILPNDARLLASDYAIVATAADKLRFTRPIVEDHHFEFVAPGARVGFSTDALSVVLSITYTALSTGFGFSHPEVGVYVDGVLTTTYTGTVEPTVPESHDIVLAFGSSVVRRIELVWPYGDSMDLTAVKISRGASITLPPARPTEVIGIGGDSIQHGALATGVTTSAAFLMGIARNAQIVNIANGGAQVDRAHGTAMGNLAGITKAMYCIGFNNYNFQTNLTAFQSEITAYVAAFRAVRPTTSLYLITPLYATAAPTTPGSITLQQYRDAITAAYTALSGSDANLHWLDGLTLMTNNVSRLNADLIHPNNLGAAEYAAALAAALV